MLTPRVIELTRAGRPFVTLRPPPPRPGTTAARCAARLFDPQLAG
jgi:hypothetical protein